MAKRSPPHRRVSGVVPILVAISVGSMTWAALSVWHDSSAGPRIVRSVADTLSMGPWADRFLELIALQPSAIFEEVDEENDEEEDDDNSLAGEAVVALSPGAAMTPDPNAQAASPRAAANAPAELATVTQAPLQASGDTAPVTPAAALPLEMLTAATSPLEPLDTSSPRATLRGFCDTIDHVYRNLIAGLTRDTRLENAHLIRQGLTCLDLSEFAPALAESKGREAATCLKEVFDRIPFPADSAIPDAAAVKADSITRWRVPGTEIVLMQIESGARQGDLVVTSESVTRAEGYYFRVRNLPYKSDAGSPGLYNAYVTVGGNLIPESFIRGLPHWAHCVVLGETVWQWAAAVLLAMAFGLVAMLASAFPRIFRPGWSRSITSFLLPVVLAGGSVVADWLLTFQVRLTGDTLVASKLTLRLTLYAGAIAAVMAVMARITGLLVRTQCRRQDGIDVQLIRLACRVCTFVIVAWIGIHAADSLGIPVAPLLAGLGASGLAVALAAQYSIENLIAGVVLFTDKPVRIGDECQFGEVRGRVEQIGLRSTRIRGSDRSLISVPNAEFAKVQLVNYTRRDRIPIRLPVEIRRDVSPAQVRDLLTRFRDVVGDHVRLDPGSPRVRLTGQSSEAYTIEISAVALTSDEGEMQTIREEILLSIMDEIERRHCDIHGEETGQPLLRAVA